MGWQDLVWPPSGACTLTHICQRKSRQMALENGAHPLLPFLLLFSSSLCGWPKSKSKRERAAMRMEKKWGEGCPNATLADAMDSQGGKRKGKKAEGKEIQTERRLLQDQRSMTCLRVQRTRWGPLDLQPVCLRWRSLGRKARTRGACLQFSTVFADIFLSRCRCSCDEESQEANVVKRVWENDGIRQI